MNITKGQFEEIDFLEKHFDAGKTTDEQKKEYIDWSVLGKEVGSVGSKEKHPNPLMDAKRNLDISLKQWRQDIKDGLFYVGEFVDDFNHPYATKLFNGILKGINFSGWKKGDGFPVFATLNIIAKKDGISPNKEEEV